MFTGKTAYAKTKVYLQPEDIYIYPQPKDVHLQVEDIHL